MATIFGSNSNNTLIVEGDDLQGLAGDDTYVVTNGLANSPDQAGRTVVITDTEGSNRLQLADGLQIASLQFLGGNAVQITLSNNLRIQVVGADRFAFDIGGNAAAADSNGLIGRNFAQLASDFGVTLQNGAGATTVPVTVAAGANPLGPATPPAGGFQAVALTGNVAALNGVAESFVYSYQLVDGRATNLTGGSTYNITGFNPAEDRLVFDNVGSSTALTEAQVAAVPGLSITENPFQNTTSLLVDPFNGVDGGVVLVGLVDAALATVNLIGS